MLAIVATTEENNSRKDASMRRDHFSLPFLFCKLQIGSMKVEQTHTQTFLTNAMHETSNICV